MCFQKSLSTVTEPKMELQNMKDLITDGYNFTEKTSADIRKLHSKTKVVKTYALQHTCKT